MCDRAVGSKMSIVDCRNHRDRSGGTSVLHAVLERQLLDEGKVVVVLVGDDVVMNRTSSALDGAVRGEVVVLLSGMRDASLHKSARDWVLVAIAATTREEADVMALAADDDGELGVDLRVDGAHHVLHVSNLLVEHELELALGDTIAEVDDLLWNVTAIKLRPVGDQISQLRVDDVRRDDLNAIAIDFADSGISSELTIERHSQSSHRRGPVISRGSVGDIGADDSSWDLAEVGVKSIETASGKAGSAAHLGVDLHADVADVLVLGLEDVNRLHDLAGNAIADLARLLDAAVQVGVLSRYDEKQDVRLHIVLIAWVLLA